MVKMIPSIIRKDNPSYAEKKVFKLIKNMDYECTVLHSLGISEHNNKVFGEIDFLVICKEGMLCLEVKGGAISRKGGQWYSSDKSGQKHQLNESPFDQAIDNMYSLKNYIKKNVKNSSLHNCQYASGVIFPDVPFNKKGPEIIPDIIFDKKDYHNSSMEDYIKRCFEYWRNKLKSKHNFEGGYLNKFQIKSAERLLRGDFGIVPSMKSRLKLIDEELIKLTEEQYNILSMLNNNDRIIVEGGAGTGKTLLGMEKARRAVLADKNVLFMCFNKLLAKEIRYSFKNNDQIVQDRIDVWHFHGFLINILKNYGYHNHLSGYSDKNVFFKRILPEKFVECVEAFKWESNYDLVIIDEAQDLLRIDYSLCIDKIIKNGWKEGKWCLFYDSNQNIYNQNEREELKFTLQEIEECRPVNVELTINCRNTRQIGVFNTLMTAVCYEEYLSIDGEKVDRDEYVDNIDLRRKVSKLVRKLLGKGIKPRDITILSPYTFSKSFLNGKDIFGSGATIKDITKEKRNPSSVNTIKFSTIQSFKGLESRIIILTDIDDFKDKRLLNYTAISRAKIKLYIFYHEQVEDEMFEMVNQGADLLP